MVQIELPPDIVCIYLPADDAPVDDLPLDDGQTPVEDDPTVGDDGDDDLDDDVWDDGGDNFWDDADDVDWTDDRPTVDGTTVDASDGDLSSEDGWLIYTTAAADDIPIQFGSIRSEGFIGTSQPDGFNGVGGDDSLLGNGGGDILIGGDGDDQINGGKGSDKLTGGNDDDDILGAKGADTIRGDDGNDTINGGRGNDRVFGGEGDDSIISGKGRDRIFVEPGGADTLSDFNAAVDTLDFTGAPVASLKALEAVATDLGGDLKLDFGGGDVWIIRNTTIDDLTPGNTEFAARLSADDLV